MFGRDATALGVGDVAPAGYVPQGNALDPELTVRQHLMLFAALHGERDAAQTTAEVLTAVGLDGNGVADRDPVKLSGGQRRRLAYV